MKTKQAIQAVLDAAKVLREILYALSWEIDPQERDTIRCIGQAYKELDEIRSLLIVYQARRGWLR
jgi:hypothetical protein